MLLRTNCIIPLLERFVLTISQLLNIISRSLTYVELPNKSNWLYHHIIDVTSNATTLYRSFRGTRSCEGKSGMKIQSDVCMHDQCMLIFCLQFEFTKKYLSESDSTVCVCSADVDWFDNKRNFLLLRNVSRFKRKQVNGTGGQVMLPNECWTITLMV